jgi:ubiquinone/menaquinone biosynthesis C-methylase UbiE
LPENKYVHGYDQRESIRLKDQADTLTSLLHGDTAYPKGSLVLEAGCGVGAQSVILASQSPDAKITSMDISPSSILKAQERINAEKIKNITFLQGDIFNLPFEEESFDHVFVCFVLEHLKDPVLALKKLKKILKKGGSLTVIEGDHDTSVFHPYSDDASKTIDCLVKLQAKAGGNALIGRELYPVISNAGFNDISVSPRVVYADESLPHMVEGFILNTFNAMVRGIRDEALSSGMIDAATFDKGIADLDKCAQKGGTFSYTFYKAVGYK